MQLTPHRERVKFSRNRTDLIHIKDVKLDQHGNIISMPPTRGLRCFGNVTEYLWGRYDTMNSFRIFQSPSGCAGCKSAPACGTVVYKRIESCAIVAHAYSEWKKETKVLPFWDKIDHETFTTLSEACATKMWTSSNNSALIKLAERKKEERKKDQDILNLNRVSISTRNQICRVAKERSALLVRAQAQPNAPTWIRNLLPDSIQLTCDTWKIHELLKHQRRKTVKASDITRYLIQKQEYASRAFHSLHSRVLEAMRRVGRLEASDNSAPLWPEFELITHSDPRGDP